MNLPTSGIWYVILFTVVPILGMILTNLLYLSSFKALYEMYIKKSTQDINVYLFPFMLGNAITWTLYGIFAIQNFYVFWANAPGILILLFSLITSYGVSFLEEDVKTYENILKKPSVRILIVLLIDFIIIIPVLFVVSMILTDSIIIQWILGILGNVYTLLMYAAPLLVIYRCIQEKNSNRINIILCVVQIIHAGLWGVYGIFLNLSLMYVPNLIGVVLGMVQGVVFVLFPKKLKEEML